MSSSGQPLRDGGVVYKDDEVRLQKLSQEIQDKWYYRSLPDGAKERSKVLDEFSREVRDRFLQLGYVVNIDITPALVGVGSPDIAIVQRLNYQEIDHDHLKHDVIKEYRNEGRL